MRQPLKGILALVLGFVLATAVATIATIVPPLILGLDLPPAAVGVVHLAAWIFFGWTLSSTQRVPAPAPQDEPSLTSHPASSEAVSAQKAGENGIHTIGPITDEPALSGTAGTRRENSAVGGRHAAAFLALAVVLSFGGGYLGTRATQISDSATDEVEAEPPSKAQLKSAAEDRLANPAWVTDVVRDLRLAGHDVAFTADSLDLYFDSAVELCHRALDGQSIVQHITRTVEPMAEDAELDAVLTLLYTSIWSATEETCLQPQG